MESEQLKTCSIEMRRNLAIGIQVILNSRRGLASGLATIVIFDTFGMPANMLYQV
jgi:hypothetical protein